MRHLVAMGPQIHRLQLRWHQTDHGFARQAVIEPKAIAGPGGALKSRLHSRVKKLEHLLRRVIGYDTATIFATQLPHTGQDRVVSAHPKGTLNLNLISQYGTQENQELP